MLDVQHVYEVPMSDIKLAGINVRTDVDEHDEGIQELAESIKTFGLMQPIVLRGSHDQPGPYDVVVGQRRFLAHKLLGENKIKATFTGNVSDIEATLISLSENMQRVELNHADTAEAITRLYSYYGKDEREVQKALGLNIRTIRNFIKVEEQATEKIKDLLRNSKITLTDARRAIDAAQGDVSKADKLIDEISKLTKYEKIRAVKFASSNPEATVDKIIADAKKPKFEETIILNLPLYISDALQKASERLALDPEVVTMNALSSWLKSNDFLQEEII